MEVLSVSPPSVNAFSSVSPHSAPPRRTSLLDRRADHSDVPLSRNATLSITQTVPLATSTLRPARQPSRSALRFVPLTPIMASPRLTPEPSQASAPAAISARLEGSSSWSENDDVDERDKDGPRGAGDCDYLNRGHLHTPRRSLSHSVLLGADMPTWTSTPPTPPPKGAVLPHRVHKSRSRTRSGARPASIAALRAPASPHERVRGPARRRSLPDLHKPLPATPKPLPPAPPDRMVALLPSLSRRAPRGQSPLRGELIGAAGLVSSLSAPCESALLHGDEETEKGERERDRGRKLFILDADDGEASDREEQEQVSFKERRARVASMIDSLQREQERAAERDRERQREERARARRYHALLELLTTEVGYLTDLRALVTIYLDQLLALTTFRQTATPHHSPSSTPQPSPGRPAPSLSALSMTGLSLARTFPASRSSFLNPSPAPSPSPSASEGMGGYIDERDRKRQSSGGSEREKDERAGGGRYPRARLLSEKDVRAVCRNAEELLRFHERFVEELRAALGPMGFEGAFASTLEGEKEAGVEERIEQAVGAVAAKFINEAPAFSIYEAFCPGHSEAAALVRNAQEHFPVEWDAYEQRCSLLVAHAFDFVALSPDPNPSSPTEDPVIASPVSIESPARPTTPPRHQRRHSTSSLAMPVSPTGLLPYVASHMYVPAARSRSDPAEHKRKHSGSGGQPQGGRLKLVDYLIKPVQRVCKYPLLLDQLRSKRPRAASAPPSSEGGVGGEEPDPIDRASDAMRLVVGLVNRASEKRARNLRSSLIASRLAFALGPSGLTIEFVASLGVCVLAGAMDVVRHPSVLHTPGSGQLRAKYLGAFLYGGGYMLLVKVTKSGRVYEPRHWFSLAGFDVVDIEGDDASLPYSFHLCGNGHHLQLAAACHPEKMIWMSAINEVLAMRPSWMNEPLSSLQADEKALPTSTADDGPTEWLNLLPTIQSMSEMEQQSEHALDAMPSKRLSKTLSRLDGMALRQEQQQLASLTRRSSTASVKAFFSPIALDTTRISRPSAQVRQQVEQGLHDVFSENCLSTRALVQMREEELFQVRKKPGGMPRSNSALSITGAMGLAAAKRRYDSVVVSRRKSSIDSVPDLTLASRRRKKQPPSICPSAMGAMPRAEADTLSPDVMLDSPTPASQCSSTSTSSNPTSILPSPVDVQLPLSALSLGPGGTIRPSDVLLVRGENDAKPKRTRSMVDNVRYFFQPRSESPTSSSGHTSPTPPSVTDNSVEFPSGIVQWLRRGSLRRRVQSSPEVPVEDSCSSLTPLGHVSEDGHLSLPTEPATPPRRGAHGNGTLNRRRSLFVPASRDSNVSPRGSRVFASNPIPSLPRPRKSLKNLFFQRSNSLSPMPMNLPPNS